MNLTALARGRRRDGPAASASRGDAILNVLPLPVLLVDDDNQVVEANAAAEFFFDMSRVMLCRHRLADLLPFGSPILSLVDEARRRSGSMNEYRVDIGNPRIGSERIVDVFVAAAGEADPQVVLMLQERTLAEKIDRQLTHRGAARSISALGSMLAHEIKNPLSGIRGAAQLLETSVDDADRTLTRLICEETDRIVKLVDRFEDFADGRPLEREAVNIHAVLEHVKRLAVSGFARHIRFIETYDPSLPPVMGNRDQLIQVFLNLVKNAAEAIGPDAVDGEIELTTAFRPGVRMTVPGTRERVSLPLEFCVRDNGPGVPEDLARHLFDPFVTTKQSGSGLGLALVAKIVGDHGGVVECDSLPRRTTFRALMPMHVARDGRA
ncbi:ATP-binding protein [Alsobacter sp. KACC 23698]|uniref:histidine kinase n=1 Tax=Alsobacter sp. KACC 23698 TaxID=3149229 RepID=A0AAU7JMJ1_9HYPH